MRKIMDRREALRKTAVLLGAAVSASSFAAILNGCKATPDLNYKPQFLTEDQAGLISELTELFIPKTDTPGAKELGVPEFIDRVFGTCYSVEEKERFSNGLKAFDEGAKKEYGSLFMDCSSEQQLMHTQKMNAIAVAAMKPAIDEKRPFILMVKELTLLGFFTSEVGATQVLQYDPVPGAYRGCIPLHEAGNGKTWATR